jgi:hypothetical protein
MVTQYAKNDRSTNPVGARRTNGYASPVKTFSANTLVPRTAPIAHSFAFSTTAVRTGSEPRIHASLRSGNMLFQDSTAKRPVIVRVRAMRKCSSPHAAMERFSGERRALPKLGMRTMMMVKLRAASIAANCASRVCTCPRADSTSKSIRRERNARYRTRNCLRSLTAP